MTAQSAEGFVPLARIGDSLVRVVWYLVHALRWREIALIVAILYVGSYYSLSRRGMREAPVYGICGFLYVSFDEANRARDLSRHYWLSILFAPINWLDHLISGADGPTMCLLRLSG